MGNKDTQFPRTKQCGLEVRKVSRETMGIFGDYYVLAADVERLLECASKVWLCKSEMLQTAHLAEPVNATHTARLIMIEPIQKDTAESLLREFVACCEVDDPKLRWGELKDRARQLLARSEEK